MRRRRGYAGSWLAAASTLLAVVRGRESGAVFGGANTAINDTIAEQTLKPADTKTTEQNAVDGKSSSAINGGIKLPDVVLTDANAELPVDIQAVIQQYEQDMVGDGSKAHVEVVEKNLPAEGLNNKQNEQLTGFPFEPDHEFPGGFYVDTVLRTHKDRWAIYKGHVFGSTDYWDLCIIYVQKIDPNLAAVQLPKVDCGYLRPVVARELVQNPSDVYPPEAPYCVSLSEKEDTKYRGHHYRYWAWQFFQRVPKFQPSFRPRETFESHQLTGVQYRFEKFLGRGTYGEAYLGIRLTDNRPVVIKVLSANPKTPAHVNRGPQVVFDKPRQLLPGSTKSERDACNLSQELFAQISDKSKSRFVGCLEGDGWIKHSSGVDLIYAIWEYGGSSIEQDPPTNLGDALVIMKSVLEGIQIITKKGDIVHRDIKIPNIVWDANKIVRLIDYSLSRRMRSNLEHGNRCYHTQRYNRTRMLLTALDERKQRDGKKWDYGWYDGLEDTTDFQLLRDNICEQEKFSTPLEKHVEKATDDVNCRMRLRQPTMYATEMPRLDAATEAQMKQIDPVSFRWGMWCEEYGYVIEHFGKTFVVHGFDEWPDDETVLPALETGRVVTILSENQLLSEAYKRDQKKNEVTCANGLMMWFDDWPHKDILAILKRNNRDERDIRAYNAALHEVQEKAKTEHTHCISWTAEAAPAEVKNFMIEFAENDPRSFDVHSLGVVMSHMLRDHFEQLHDSPIYQLVAYMVERMTDPDPANRMSGTEALQQLHFVRTYYDSRDRGLTGRSLITSLQRQNTPHEQL